MVKLFVFELVLLDLVIFPSFLFISKLSLFSCLSVTLLNLISPTLSTKSWHSLSLCVEIIDASCDLHSSNCLARNIKESIYIRVNNPSLNNNIG